MNAILNSVRIALVVEDDPLIRGFEVATLKRAGYEVLAAADGIDGGALFARHFQEIDVLVTDISMPGMDGLKLAAFARKIRADLSILFASGSVEQEHRELAAQITGSIFLPKPFTSEELLSSVGMVLDLRERCSTLTAAELSS